MNLEAKPQDAAPGSRPKIGILAAGELRLAGLAALLEAGGQWELLMLPEPRLLASVAMDLVLLDTDATPHPLELIRSLARMRPLLRVLVLGADPSPGYIEQVVESGAKGYLLQSATQNELHLALTVVLDGSLWAPRKILSRLLDRARREQAERPAAEITPTTRELQVVRLLARGLGNRDIAENLQVGEATIKAHLTRLMRKAEVTNRTALTLRAVELGWCRLTGT